MYIVYAPYWLKGQGVILEQEVISTTPIKSKSYPGADNKSRGSKNAYQTFLWDTL